MSFDLKLQRTCSHEILDEQVTIQGLSPSFISVLRFQTDGSSNFITVRELGKTEGLSNYQYVSNGFSNWTLGDDNQTVNWNAKHAIGSAISAVTGFVDGSTHIFPAPAYLVSYRCISTECPMCLEVSDEQGFLTKDTEFDAHGQLSLLESREKVKQLVFKAVLTEIGANEVAPEYGSTLSAAIGQKYDAFMEMRIYNSIQQTITHLIEEQQGQLGLPFDETLLGISRILLVQDTNDPRIIRVTIVIKLGDFETLDVSFNLVSQ